MSESWTSLVSTRYTVHATRYYEASFKQIIVHWLLVSKLCNTMTNSLGSFAWGTPKLFFALYVGLGICSTINIRQTPAFGKRQEGKLLIKIWVCSPLQVKKIWRGLLAHEAFSTGVDKKILAHSTVKMFVSDRPGICLNISLANADKNMHWIRNSFTVSWWTISKIWRHSTYSSVGIKTFPSQYFLCALAYPYVILCNSCEPRLNAAKHTASCTYKLLQWRTFAQGVLLWGAPGTTAEFWT